MTGTTSNVTYWVELDKSDAVDLVVDHSNQKNPFEKYNFQDAITLFGGKTLRAIGNGNHIGLTISRNPTPRSHDLTRSWISVYGDGRWAHIIGAGTSFDHLIDPLIYVFVAPYDYSYNETHILGFPDNIEKDKALMGEMLPAFEVQGQGTNLCVAVAPEVHPIFLYVGTQLNYCNDMFDWIRDVGGQEAPPLKNLKYVVNHTAAHELCHFFGIADRDDTDHSECRDQCVMNAACVKSETTMGTPGPPAQPGLVHPGMTTAELQALNTYLIQNVFALFPDASHNHASCDYQDLVAWYHHFH